ncbi:POK8 protein, partial [Gymnorhina tibicen]|nr:POK8 protein [Gymnorhina tibicen]
PLRRFHWRVLPMGMKNSPTICQWYVAKVLSPIRKLAARAIILHYMDDVLVCAPNSEYLDWTLRQVIQALESEGFEIQSEKVQRVSPWRYLGMKISEQTVVPQAIKINDNPKTLRDLHQLCGSINWVRPLLGLTTEDLAPLFNLLRGSDGLDSPRTLTPEARRSIEKVQHALENRQAHRCLPHLPFQLIILGAVPHLHAMIFQWDEVQRDPLLIIEWVFLSYQPSKSITTPQELMAQLIMRARARLRTLAGCDFTCIYLPLTKDSLEHLLQNNVNLQYALDSYPGQISIHNPKHRLFNSVFKLIPRSIQSSEPLNAVTIFTDGSGASHKDPRTQQWEADVEVVKGSPQVAELAAVVRAFERFQEPFNLVTDSAYVAGVVSRAERALLKEVANPMIYGLLSKLVTLLSHRKQPFYVMHVRSHTDLPGYIAEGNRRADSLAMPVQLARLPDTFQQAKISHAMFHQNVPALVRMFHLTRDQARAIVATCPNCQHSQLPSLGSGVNPRGLGSCEVWQTDITHFAPFGRLKYIHVSIDTFSGAVFASAHSGEKTRDAINHLILAFATLGIPKELKTDNGPAYSSKDFKTFRQQWGVEHTTGIPHSPTGQSIVERAHQTLKKTLERQ